MCTAEWLRFSRTWTRFALHLKFYRTWGALHPTGNDFGQLSRVARMPGSMTRYLLLLAKHAICFISFPRANTETTRAQIPTAVGKSPAWLQVFLPAKQKQIPWIAAWISSKASHLQLFQLFGSPLRSLFLLQLIIKTFNWKS